jgi:1,4-dihydroxy-2-naphthoate octaprenyltransferase
MVVVFGLALAVGSYLTWVAGPAIVAIGIASIVCAIAYTGGPYPLGYHGLGDLFVFLFFGLVAVCGTAFVHLGQVPQLSLWAATPIGLLAANLLVVNNVRDVDTDARAGKRTLPVRFGRGFGVLQYAVGLSVAVLIPVWLVLSGVLTQAGLLPLSVLPLGVLLLMRLARERGRSLNQVLGSTAKLLLFYGVLFSIGIAQSAGS